MCTFKCQIAHLTSITFSQPIRLIYYINLIRRLTSLYSRISLLMLLICWVVQAIAQHDITLSTTNIVPRWNESIINCTFHDVTQTASWRQVLCEQINFRNHQERPIPKCGFLLVICLTLVKSVCQFALFHYTFQHCCHKSKSLLLRSDEVTVIFLYEFSQSSSIVISIYRKVC
jgi:hypothetical protein